MLVGDNHREVSTTPQDLLSQLLHGRDLIYA